MSGPRIRHIVMWKVLGDTPEAHARNVARVREVFEAMAPQIPGLLHLEIGVDTSRVDYACDVVLYADFASQAALDAYAVHPAHVAAKDALQGLRTTRHQVDYPLPS